MANWLKSLLIGAGAALICFFIYRSFELNKKVRSYDASYHVEIKVSEYEPPEVSREILERMPFEINERVRLLGYEPLIAKTSPRSMNILVKNVSDTLQLLKAIASRSKLELYEVYSLPEISSGLMALEAEVKKQLTPTVPKEERLNDTLKKLSFRKDKEVALINFPDDPASLGIVGQIAVKDTSILSNMFNLPEIKALFPADLRFLYSVKRNELKKQLELFAIRTKMDESELQNKDVQWAEPSYSGAEPEVRFELTEAGARKWLRMTTDNKGKVIAIIIDDQVVTAPRVNEPITDGVSSITGGLSVSEAESIALQLRSAPFSAPVAVITQSINPTGRRQRIIGKLVSIFIPFVLVGCLSWFLFNSVKED